LGDQLAFIIPTTREEWVNRTVKFKQEKVTVWENARSRELDQTFIRRTGKPAEVSTHTTGRPVKLTKRRKSKRVGLQRKDLKKGKRPSVRPTPLRRAVIDP